MAAGAGRPAGGPRRGRGEQRRLRREPTRRVGDLANEGDLALDAAVFTADYDRALDPGDGIRAGAVRINGPPSHGLGDIPFGGRKRSGTGREGLGHTVREFTTTKSIVL